MSADVIRMGDGLTADIIANPTPNERAVELVQHLYDQIMSGEVQGLVVITVHNDAGTSANAAGLANTRAAVGALEEIKLTMLQNMIEED